MGTTEEQFSSEFQALLEEMQNEGTLVPFLMCHGDALLELREALNNEVLSRIEEKEACVICGAKVDDEDQHRSTDQRCHIGCYCYL